MEFTYVCLSILSPNITTYFNTRFFYTAIKHIVNAFLLVKENYM